MDFAEITIISNKLVEELKKEFNELRDIDYFDILLETTPLQTYNKVRELEDFEFWNPRKQRYDKTPAEINSNLKYLLENMQAYLFCNPKYEHELYKVTRNEKFNEILGKL